MFPGALDTGLRRYDETGMTEDDILKMKKGHKKKTYARKHPQ
jgi:hypothetical protein